MKECKSLEENIITGDTYSAYEYVHSSIHILTDLWLSKDRGEFDKQLKLAEQDLEAALEELPDCHEFSFLCGELSGSLRVLKRMYLATGERERIISGLAEHSRKSEEILQCLYMSQTGMRHGELAEAIDSSPNALTNVMKKVVASGAVEVSRSGKNTFYVLSHAGRKYCESRKRGEANLETKLKQIQQSINILEKQLNSLAQKETSKLPQVSLTVGELFYSYVNDSFRGLFQINNLIKIGDQVVADLEYRKEDANTIISNQGESYSSEFFFDEVMLRKAV